MGGKLSEDDIRFIKKTSAAIRRGEIPEMCDRQLGLLIGHRRADGVAPSRLTVLRARKLPSRRPALRKRGPKFKFQWCRSYLLRTARRLLKNDKNPWPVTSDCLQECIRDWRRREVRRRRQQGEVVGANDLPIPSTRTIVRELNRKGLFTFDSVNFHELTRDQKKKRINFCKRILRAGWYNKVDLFMDEKSWHIRRCAKHRLMVQRSKHRRVYSQAVNGGKRSLRVRKNGGRKAVSKSDLIRLDLRRTKKNIGSRQVVAGVEPRRNRRGPGVSLWAQVKGNKLNSKSVADVVIKWAEKYRRRRNWSRNRWVRIVIDNARYHGKLFKGHLQGHKIMILYSSPWSPDIHPCDFVRI